MTTSSLRDRLIGTWELVHFYGELPDNPSDKHYPLGPNAKGKIMYAPDGYMFCAAFPRHRRQLRQPERPWCALVLVFQLPYVLTLNTDVRYNLKQASSNTEAAWAEIGRNYLGYTGRFWLDESPDGSNVPLLNHEMGLCNLPSVVGAIQQRNMRMEEEDGVTYLYLGVDRMEMEGQPRVVKVKWRRCVENRELRPPESGTRV